MKSITGKPRTLFMIACTTVEEALHMSTEQLFYKTWKSPLVGDWQCY